MTPNDLIFEELTEKQLQSLRVDAGMRRKVLNLLRRLEKDIVARMSDEDNFTQRRLAKMLSDVRKSINKTYVKVQKVMEKDLKELGKIEAESMMKTLDAAVAASSASVTVKAVTEAIEQSLIAGAPSQEWWDRQSKTLQRKFTDQVRMGTLLGESNQKIIRRVRGTRALGYTNGIMNTARNNAEALVRSSVQTATNQARFKVMEANSELISAYKHVATLDGRTSDQCIVRDGKRWNSETKAPIGHSLGFQVPPIHWNCRSTLIVELEGVELPEDATRASVDGQVPASTTFEDFLKKKGDAFSDEVLGPGKAKLYRDGKITIRQLLDQSGNPLTLKQLKQKYNV